MNNSQEKRDSPLLTFPYISIGIYGGDGETRTLTGFPIRPSNVRVYQFRHIPINFISNRDS